jgi:hypothetical protein
MGAFVKRISKSERLEWEAPPGNSPKLRSLETNRLRKIDKTLTDKGEAQEVKRALENTDNGPGSMSWKKISLCKKSLAMELIWRYSNSFANSWCFVWVAGA